MKIKFTKLNKINKLINNEILMYDANRVKISAFNNNVLTVSLRRLNIKIQHIKKTAVETLKSLAL